MYRVALCEDESFYLQEQKKICCNILEKLNIEYHIDVFENSKDFINAFSKEKKRFDLLLLDILMDKPDGMELARIIRKADKETPIIFITSNPDFAIQGYDVQALHYLMKPVDSDILERLIASDYNNRFKNNFFIFESGTQKIKVPLKDIVYMETVGRRVFITLLKGTVYYSGKLTELLEELPKEMFIRCHQSFAINSQNIREVDRLNAIAVNGMTIPISRAYSKDVQKAFLRYMRNS